jgi:ribonuclease BN (tRNA processing enzyme)
LEGACSSYAISDGERIVLLDCGPGTLERVWRFGMLSKLDAIVISHMHADHVLDLLLFAGELVREELAGKRPLLYVPAGDGPRVLDALDVAFSRTPKPSTRFETFQVSEYRETGRLTIGALELSFATTSHPQPCYAARVSNGTAALVYGADGGPCEAVQRLATDTDLLILEATFADDAATAAMHGHMTATQAGELATRARARRLLLTHLLPGNGRELLAHARATFHGRIDLAREGLTYELI